MDVFELGGGEWFTFAFEVGDLAGDELERAGSAGEFKDDILVLVLRIVLGF